MKEDEQIEEALDEPEAERQDMKANGDEGNGGEPVADEASQVPEGTEEAPADEATDPGDALAELQNRLLRLQADFDNFRKRTRREKETWNRQAQEAIVLELLIVLDHFELALKDAEASESHAGFQMIFDQFTTALKKFGVAAVQAEGEAFNPELHEAISHTFSDEVAADQVLAQTRRGYVMGDKLIRPAQVVVSQGPGKAGEEDANEGEET
ncbi:MAG: nucleotide exchange factor GrpE [Verrucomicrobiota bacterium]